MTIVKNTIIVWVMCVLAAQAVAHDHDSTVWGVDAINATGFNRLKGHVVMNLGAYGTLGFDTVGVQVRNAERATPVNDVTPENALLATYVDEAFLANFMGGVSVAKLPIDTLNIPLRDVGVNASPYGVDYFPAPAITEVAQGGIFQPAQSLPADPVTLADWMNAKGRMSFKCDEEGYSEVKIRMNGLLPNRMYTVWGFFDSQETLPFDDFGPIRPLGGVSNLVVSDGRGAAEYKRVLNFCPMEIKQGEVPLAAVFVYFHSDQMTYGAVPSFIDEGRFPGATGHVALQFPVAAESSVARYRQEEISISSDGGPKLDNKAFTAELFADDPFFTDSTAPQRVIKGVIATGMNKGLTGKPIGILADGIGAFGFSTAGVYDATSDVPKEFSVDTPDSAILATVVDKEPILARFGAFDPEKFATGARQNIPFHFTPIAIDGTGLNREALPGILDGGQMDYARAEPSDPLTVGRFKKAEGIVKFSCPENEMARVAMKFKNLIPNQYYDVFEWYETGQPVGVFDILPQYVGGLPDAFVSNEYGEGELRAYLNRCPPLTPHDDGIALVWVLVLRNNHESHATTIIAPMHPRDPRLPGEIGTAHMIFPLRATPANQ